MEWDTTASGLCQNINIVIHVYAENINRSITKRILLRSEKLGLRINVGKNKHIADSMRAEVFRASEKLDRYGLRRHREDRADKFLRTVAKRNKITLHQNKISQ
jgi:hypothetical protein